jgi:tripartite-type tricarboxylate transporter receptor subunit TctC
MGAAAMAAFSLACAQDFPSHTIRMITASPGGGVDFATRLVAQRLGPALGQQVVVENHAGSGIVAGDLVAKAPADGHTMLLYGTGINLLPFMRDSMPFDPVRDLAPVAITNNSPSALVVHPSLPVKSVRDLIQLAKAKPGQLNYASIGSGTSSQLSGELFKFMSGTNIVNVAFRGNVPAITAVISGEVQLHFGAVSLATQMQNQGKLRFLAVTSAKPSALAPGVPTAAATGLPGYESMSTNALWVPGKTPQAVITRINQEVVRILNQADVKQQFFNAGLEIVGSSPAEMAAMLKADAAKMGKVIKAAGIRDE